MVKLKNLFFIIFSMTIECFVIMKSGADILSSLMIIWIELTDKQEKLKLE